MSDLGDYRLDTDANADADSGAGGEAAPDPPDTAPPESAEGPPGPPRSSSPPTIAVVAVIAALVVAALLYFWLFGRQPPPPEITPSTESAPTTPRPPARVEGEPIEDEPLPGLDASDEVVRRLVAGLSENPQLAAWLVTDDLARRFVVAVDNIAEGVTPRSHLGFIEPTGGFEVETTGERYTVSAASYKRYDTVTDVFTSLDTEGSVRLYRRLQPLLQEAYVDLGYPNRDFGDTLARALQVIAGTPRPPETMELVRGVKSYEFADPRLEDLSSIEKQLLRLGPENLERVQTKAAELAAALAAE